MPIIPPLISRSGCCSASPPPRPFTIPPLPRSRASSAPPPGRPFPRSRVPAAAARRPITALTLAGGFASTVSWPATHVLLEAVGWRGTYLVYAALLALVAAPLHAFALPRTRADVAAPTGQSVQAPSAVLPPTG